MKIFLRTFLATLIIMIGALPVAVYAVSSQPTTFLPRSEQETTLPVANLPKPIQDLITAKFDTNNGQVTISNCRQLKELRREVGPLLHGRYLATKIRCGQMQMGDIPYYIKHALEFLIWIAGTISVVMIMIGGYQYAIGGITENKEDGKKTITSAIIGLIVTLIAWVVINVVQALLTAPTTFEQPAQAAMILARHLFS